MLQIKIGMAFRQVLLNVELIFIVIIILSTAKFTKSETKYNASSDIHLIPLHYDVKVKFDAYNNVLSGNCYIKIQIFRRTKNITIMSPETFAIVKIDLINNNNNQIINISKYCFINKTYIHLDFTQSSVDFLSPDTYILKIRYKSIIFDDGDIFESFNTDKEEEKILNDQSIIIIRARQLFPCLDGTLFKSTFNISIKHHKNHNFLSNMPIFKQVDDLNNMLWTQYDISSSMSAEHLIFVMTFNYDLIFFPTIENVTFWCRKEITEQIRYAKTIVHRVVLYLRRKTTRKIPKMDFIVINKDFNYSNVKIPGFILLREDVICNDKLDHIACKTEVANLIARETISYWYDDVFLWSKNEFIVFLAAHILDQTELYRMDLFVVQTLQESLRLDSLPLSSYANNSIVHSFQSSLHSIKSFIIWRMLYNLLSENVFWRSINRYVNTNYYQTNATDNNLSIVSFWAAMERALSETTINVFDFNIKDFVDFWSLEGYHPVLYVTRDNSTNLTLIYNNFEDALLIGMKQYRIYFTYTIQSNMNFGTSSSQRWISPLSSHYYVFDIGDNDWIIVNLQQVGYYRVYYDEDNWRKIEYYLLFANYTYIPVLNRAQIIDDAFHFMTLGQLKFGLFCNIAGFLIKDTDYVSWYPMIKATEYMTCIWAIQDGIIVKNKINEMFENLLLNIGYDDKLDESDFTKCLKEEAIKWACVLDAPECRTTAIFQLEKHLESSAQDKLLKRKEWVYCKGLMAANISTWHNVLNKWTQTSDNTILEYLTCSTNTLNIQTYLVLIKEDEFYLKVSNDKVSPNKTIANIFLLIVAKHARNNEVLNYIFNHSELFDLSRNRQVDEIAVLIVIITHEHNVIQFNKVIEFVKNNLTVSAKRLVDAVRQKIEKRKKEYNKRKKSYGDIKL